MKHLKFKQGLKWLSISAGLVLLTMGGLLIFGLFLKNNTKTVTVGMVTATQDKVENKITGESGILKLENQRTIKSPTTGTVEQILVKIGDTVKKGQTLIRLRDAESQIKLQEFESDLKDKKLQINDKQSLLQQANKKLANIKIESQQLFKNSQQDIQKQKQEKTWEIAKRKVEVTKKQTAINQAERDLTEVKTKLEENKQLFAKDFISKDELTEQEKKVAQAEVNLTNAKDDLYISKIDLDKQNLELQNFLNDVKNQKSEPQQKIKDMQAKLEQAQQEVNQARLALNQVIREFEKLKIQRQKIAEELRKTVITSPVDGVILSIPVKIGDVLEPKGDVLLIGDPNQQVVELKLSPLDATKVKLRQQAEVSIVGLDSQKLTGKVQQVSLLAGEGQSSSSGTSTDSAKVTAVVQLDQVNKNIVPGTPVTVDLIIARRDNVIIIPTEAIQQTDSETFVWMRDAQGKAFKKIIQTGLQGLDNIEVKSGLKAGDEILIPNLETGLSAGDQVSIK